MPGKMNSVPFVVGEPTEPKPVRSGTCACGQTSYRERWQAGRGWFWVCYSCAPDPVALERKATRAGAPMAYVPREYERLQHIADVNHDLKTGDRVARRVDGTVVEGFRLGTQT